MNNTAGDRNTTKALDFDAFDRLPEPLRKFLSEANFSFSSEAAEDALGKAFHTYMEKTDWTMSAEEAEARGVRLVKTMIREKEAELLADLKKRMENGQ